MPAAVYGREGWLIEDWSLQGTSSGNEQFANGTRALNSGEPDPASAEGQWFSTTGGTVWYPKCNSVTLRNITYQQTDSTRAVVEYGYADGTQVVENFNGGLALPPDTSDPDADVILVQSGTLGSDDSCVA